MTDEPVRIEGLVGPYAGKRFDVSAAEAKKAIAEGWAKDPFAEPAEAKEVKELTDEERWKILEAANAAASRLRGEETVAATAKEDRAMEADKPGEYETRSSKHK